MAKMGVELVPLEFVESTKVDLQSKSAASSISNPVTVFGTETPAEPCGQGTSPTKPSFPHYGDISMFHLGR